MKKILGLDLGTNSIGWAVVNADKIIRDNENSYLKPTGISAAGSRIIPMSADILGEFDKGNSVSQTATRTSLRGVRRLHERNLQRRERLLHVLKRIRFLPEHFANQIDRYGKFIDDTEPKLAWVKNETGKYQFLFTDSFNEMLADFSKNQPQLVANGKKIPYDWTIYYLRKKALSQRLTKEELAWVLLQFNQKRGYYQLRGEEEEQQRDKLVEYLAQKVVRVEATNEKKGDDVWYNIYLENGMIYRRTSRIPLDWEGKVKEFIVTTDLEKDGTPKKDKEGNIKRSFRAPKEDDWTLLKKKTELDIDNSHKTVGCYIYDSLLQNPNQKIIGNLVRTVERKYYKEELQQILEMQKFLIPELQDENLYKSCIEELYPNNEAHRNNISKPDFSNLFINDILFYQRPLKSKKSQISDCPYESRFDKEGNEHPIKCIAKSNPLFQEFRLWQFVQNLRIYQRERILSDGQMDLFGSASSGKLQTDVDVTNEFLKSEDDYVSLFEWLNGRLSIKQDTLLNSYFKIKKEKGKDQYPYRWNYVEDKEYPCNETHAEILKGLDKCSINPILLTHDQEMSLWHILYSVEDKFEICKALKKYAEKTGLPESFAEVFAKIKPFKKDYGSYSEKAIKKLLPLMRMGKYWNAEAIDKKTKERIDKIVTGEYDESIKNRVREKAINLNRVENFKGLPVWLACYIVYDRHSEAKEIVKWEKPEDIDEYLKHFKQHSLRNPIVEQVVTETLRTVRDIWEQEGHIDEIHLELGREMKNPADKRKKMTENILQNENTNLRIKAMLMEFLNPEMGIENVRPYSPSQQDILRIYEEDALNNLSKEDPEFDFVSKISKSAQPSKSDIVRYKLWLEQKYRSPYTGEMIPLAKLFTSAYEIEHVIPQSRYFDDSFSNKVICEAEVNKLKDRQLGFEFIKNHKGEKVQISQGKTVEVLSIEAYEKFVKEHYASNRTKMKKLLMDDIPDGFIERQLNDSRYISKYMKGLLSNVVREKSSNGEIEPEAVSKNLISCNGSITDYLKKDWGMNDVWNHIVLPRFQRLNRITGKNCFTAFTPEGHEVPAMPLELQKGFNKKRIDHRHHAMDAIVIACATRDHVNLLNNEAAHSKHNANRYQLQRKLRRFENVQIDGKERAIAREFLKPWASFTTDAKQILENIIVSFKQNLRVINKTTNHIQHFDKNGKKALVKQEKGNSWAIRKSMHKDTGWGEVNLRFVKEVSLNEALKKPKAIVNKEFKQKVHELLAQGYDVKYIKKYVEDNKDVWSDIDIKKIVVYYLTQETKDRYFATRFLSDLVTYLGGLKKFEDAIKKIDGITDTGIQKILKAHLQAKDNNPELAFSPDGIDEMNRNIVKLNGGKQHKPIYKVRRYESGNKYPIGQIGCKAKKFVEADKGTNLFFAVFVSDKLNKETGEMDKVRTYLTIPLNVMIDCQKKFGEKWRNNIEVYLKENRLVSNDVQLLFILSPNDLVYLPTKEELKDGIKIVDKERIYKLVDVSGVIANFVSETIAQAIFSMTKDDQNKLFKEYRYNIQNEIGLGSRPSKSPNAITGEMIKETCVPIKVDRLGNIVELNGQKL
ncbi:MAG: type II CRISPR RNA-guided endonuclease Cas9 [Bacteroidales bacterium]|nr:type II CRISPR RNA-guided endonuclease Cas9 [Bacteroidales bacterium]